MGFLQFKNVKKEKKVPHYEDSHPLTPNDTKSAIYNDAGS